MKKLHFMDDPKEIGMCYTHVDLDTGKQHTFAVDHMNRWLDQQLVPFVLTEVLADVAEHCRTRHGVEQDRLAEMKFQDLMYPITYVEWGDGTCLLVDGNHRYVWAYDTGIKLIRARVIRYGEWDRFTLDGVPKLKDPSILHRMHSGRKPA